MFNDRVDAGKQLAKHLIRYRGSDSVLMALPRGGVPVAYQMALDLHLPVELILAKKIGHPDHKEYAIGAANLEDYFVVDPTRIQDLYIQKEINKIRKRLKIMQQSCMKDHQSISIKNKIAILVDDGMATGQTIGAAIPLLRKQNPSQIIVAVPVASEQAYHAVSQSADEIHSLLIPSEFHGVGEFYIDFNQVSDEEVLIYMDRLERLKKSNL